MRYMPPTQRLPTQERGETIFGFLVALLLSSVIFTATISSFIGARQSSSEHEMIIKAQEEAKKIADLISFELRLLGSGVPFSQSDFAIGDVTLGTAPLPIFTNASTSSISFRLNEKGHNAFLTGNFNPTITSDFTVTDASIFAEEDTVYISDMVAGGSSGLQGIITAVVGNTITIDDDYIASAGASFAQGSIVEPVRTITLNSPTNGSGITRDAEFGPVVISPNSVFALEYRDAAGTVLGLPLTEDGINDDLTSIKVTVSVNSPRLLRDGEIYAGVAEHTVALRNLILSR